MPPHLVMPAVFDQWFFHPCREWTVADIETALQQNLPSAGIQDHQTGFQQLWLDEHSKQHSTILNHLLHYNHILINWRELVKNDWDCLAEIWMKIWKELKRTFFGAQLGLPFSLHTLDRILEDPHHEMFGLKLFESCTEISHHPQWFTHYYPLPHNLAKHIIATSTPHHQTYGPPVVTGSPFVRSPTCLALFQQIHQNFLANETLSDPEKAYNWLEATDIMRYIHNLDDEQLPPPPGYFPIPLMKLKNLLWALSDKPSDNDLGFLFSCKKHWTNVGRHKKLHLIQILSDYINNFPAPGYLHNERNTNTPLVTHPKGLEFIGFLYAQWGPLRRGLENGLTSRWVEEAYTEPWMNAMKRVRAANGLSSDEFENMFTPILDSRSESPLTYGLRQSIDRDDTNMKSHAGEGDTDSAVESHSNGADVLSDEEAVEMVTGSTEEFGSCRIGYIAKDDTGLVGGIGADNNA
ncbi:hypothetical protein V5O48_010986 [Marasmius crinis-equi]|uniref:Uncharacterized protein n=1 Tax=Marasmius crinis-equi TaxID=585013 RepID=A0ABR3F6T5_9AGAR